MTIKPNASSVTKNDNGDTNDKLWQHALQTPSQNINERGEYCLPTQ